MRKFAVIGKTLSHSFSPQYFSEKFTRLHIIDRAKYGAVELADENALRNFLQRNDLDGFNVTIPYKETILTHLDKVDPIAQRIGSVNCVKREAGKWVGYNTDHIGFTETLRPMLRRRNVRALILGSGGASRAIRYSLDNLKVPYSTVSRNAGKGELTYDELTPDLLRERELIVNCTPLGTWPNVDECPMIPYSALVEGHILYDLVYNPRVTQFLWEGLNKGCAVRNGWKMLQIQADESWKIWNQS